MKRAFSLIEMIFVIVIMAGIFAVIPKIIFAANKSDTFANKQDAIFHTFSLAQVVSVLPWDENNTLTSEILQTDGDAAFACDANTHMRRGGYLSVNGRRCSQQYAASFIGSDSGENDYLLYDDLDDFDGVRIDANTSGGKRRYILAAEADYLSDDANVFDESGTSLTIDLSKATISTVTTNIKRLKIVAAYAGKREAERNVTAFSYHSANIGQFVLGRRAW